MPTTSEPEPKPDRESGAPAVAGRGVRPGLYEVLAPLLVAAVLVFVGFGNPFRNGVALVTATVLLWFLARAAKHPAERGWRLIGAGVMVAALGVAVGAQVHRESVAERAGDRAVLAVESYRTIHGRYPESLAGAGLTGVDATPGDVFYRLDGRRPRLTRRRAWWRAGFYLYDFTRRQWRRMYF